MYQIHQFFMIYKLTDARKLCAQKDHSEENVESVEMAIEEELDMFENLISLHSDGFDFSVPGNLNDAIKAIEEVTQLKAQKYNQQFIGDRYSVILQFDDCEDFTGMYFS